MERNILIADIAFYIRQGPRICCIHNFRLRLDHIQEAPKTGQAFLHHLRKLHQNLDRADENADIQCIHRQITDRHLSMRDQPSAKHQRREIHHSLKEQISTHKASHATIVCIFGNKKSLIAFFKFFLLDPFVRKRLHHTNTGQRILQTGIDISDFSAVVHECLLHFAILPIRKNQHNNYKHQHRNRQSPVDHKQKQKRSHNLNQRNKKILRAMMRQLGNIEQIRYQLTHHLSGIVLIVIRKRKLFVMVEQLFAHIAFHARTHHMPRIRHVILAKCLQNICRKKHRCNWS